MSIRSNKSFLKSVALGLALSGTVLVQAATDKAADSDDSGEKILNQFVQSKGSNIIVFDASNIKQFWIDNTVAAKDDLINIILRREINKWISEPMKIQLANVSLFQDCTIEVFSETPDLSFSVLNGTQRAVAMSSDEDPFLNYHVTAATIHMDDTENTSFFLRFSSIESEFAKIKKIVLSFKNNPNFLSSSGTIEIKELNCRRGQITTASEDHSLSLKGQLIETFSTYKIFVKDNTVSTEMIAKNIGNEPIKVIAGYQIFTQNGSSIDTRCNLYKNENQILTVLDFVKGSKTITVDTYPEWEKGCSLVLNAKSDFSDFPNTSFVGGSIQDVRKKDNDHIEILFSRAIEQAIEKGTKVRVQTPEISIFLQADIKILQPGEEAVLSFSKKKNDSISRFVYSDFCKGTYYVVPCFTAYSSKDGTKEVSLQITKFTVSY